MKDKAARLVQAGGPPEIEITIGQLHVGRFQVMLWDATGHNPRLIGESTSARDVAEVFEIAADATTAHERIVSWEVVVVPHGRGEDGPYSVIAEIRQDGSVVPDGLTHQTGRLDGESQIVFGSTRLVCV